MMSATQLDSKERQSTIDTGRVVSPAALKVLVCDDDAEMRGMLAWTLETEGFEVTTATNGLELLAAIALRENRREAGYDLIVCDIRMPGPSGMRVLELQQHNEAYPATILITAFGDKQTHAEALQRGAAAVLDKPFYLSDFLTTVRGVLRPASCGG